MADDEFTLGIVMAGAVSGGAYQAGVTDFLLQALDQWELAKKSSSDKTPNHKIRIKALAGASAGGMTASILMSSLSGAVTPVTEYNFSRPEENRLYDAWVNRIDIMHLLETKDLDADPKSPVVSLFDSSVIDEIAANAISRPQTPKSRSYFSDPLSLTLCLANRSGVPYRIDMRVFDQESGPQGLDMRMHGDNRRFYLSESNQPLPAATKLPTDNYNDPSWERLRQAAMATGAFPLGLRPRVTKRDQSDYLQKPWLIPSICDPKKDSATCESVISIEPKWPSQTADYSFITVDGGTMNNEPIDLAREAIAGPGVRLERRGDLAKAAVILIIPFPGLTPTPVEADLGQHLENIGLIQNAMAMVGAWLEQARFKPQELLLALDEDVFSRFMIAPSGSNVPPNAKIKDPIAAASFRSFGGFLERQYRDHDYQLGRRNCQRFLQEHLLLPASNSLFDNWPKAARDAFNRHDEKYGDMLPIIPVMGTATTEVPSHNWPVMTKKRFRDIADKLSARAKAMAYRFTEDPMLPGGATSWLLRRAWDLGGHVIVDRVIDSIRDDLKDRGLLETIGGA